MSLQLNDVDVVSTLPDYGQPPQGKQAGAEAVF